MRAVVLFGMSGSGKSHLARTLAAGGFRTISIDQIIQDRLNTEDGLALKSLQAVAGWMGFPDSPDYLERSQRYVSLEAEALTEAISQLDALAPPPLIIDATGSVIYLDTSLLDELRRVATIIHLDTPRAVADEMLAAFRKKPTPLIWGDCFEHRDGEDTQTALVRSYPTLLDRREVEYVRWSDLTLPYQERRQPDFDPAAFLARQHLLG